MEIFKVIKERRSVRAFSETTVDEARGILNKSPKKLTKSIRLKTLVSYNYFNFRREVVAKKDAGLKVRRLIRKIYYLLPTEAKNWFNPYIDKKFVKKFEN